jgi:lia operon protein LiaF
MDERKESVQEGHMRNKWQIFIGGFIVLIGLTVLIGNLTDYNPWKLFWPLVLIGLGVFVLVRPRMVSADTSLRQKLLGEIHLRGEWDVTDEEMWLLVGDVDIDLTRARIPAGETRFRVFGIVGEVELLLPADVGISMQANAFLTEARVLGEKSESFLSAPPYVSAGYDLAERKIRLEVNYFVADVKVKRASLADD